ncbi:hypothetical protein T07_11663 [Trichinella nelsoni]|uniref:Uncharacterized protein n=1 Tax=Trichinella nelsoni TaxID=6336 RepID=A0A0V0SJX5_9BILA|nr:hypothetical protein T07_11663 [Trichinella nelsoni]
MNAVTRRRRLDFPCLSFNAAAELALTASSHPVCLKQQQQQKQQQQ